MDASFDLIINLQVFSKNISHLILCLDPDIKGEAIGYDIIDICKKSN